MIIKCFDLLSNSLNSFFKEMFRDQFGEFVCGYWGLKGLPVLQKEEIRYCHCSRQTTLHLLKF